MYQSFPILSLYRADVRQSLQDAGMSPDKAEKYVLMLTDENMADIADEVAEIMFGHDSRSFTEALAQCIDTEELNHAKLDA